MPILCMIILPKQQNDAMVMQNKIECYSINGKILFLEKQELIISVKCEGFGGYRRFNGSK